MGFFVTPFKLLWKHRVLLWQTTRNDIRSRYAGSVFGLLWLFIYPLLFLGIYSVVQMYVYQMRVGEDSGFQSTAEFMVFIFCGLVPFIGFAEALGMGVSSVTSNVSLIKNTLFPIELIPVKAVLTSQCTQIVGMGILIIALFGLDPASTRFMTPWLLFIVPIWILQMLFTIGLIWVVSSLNVYIRDLQNIVAIITLFLMLVSPIAWLPAVFAEYPPVLIAMKFNPLYHIIFAYKHVLMGTYSSKANITPQFPEGMTFWILLIMAFALFFIGHWFFSRMKKVFVDNV